MLVGRIIGTLTCTERVPEMGGTALMQVEILGGAGDSEVIVACNATTAGVSECVIVAMGAAARYALDAPQSPIDATIIAIVDGGCGEVAGRQSGRAQRRPGAGRNRQRTGAADG